MQTGTDITSIDFDTVSIFFLSIRLRISDIYGYLKSKLVHGTLIKSFCLGISNSSDIITDNTSPSSKLNEKTLLPRYERYLKHRARQSF